MALTQWIDEEASIDAVDLNRSIEEEDEQSMSSQEQDTDSTLLPRATTSKMKLTAKLGLAGDETETEKLAAEKRRKAEEVHQTGSAANGPAFQNNGIHASQSTRHGKSSSSSQETVPPNNILFIQNLPHETTSMMLQILFQQYPGFREVRMIEAKPGISFVEFGDDVQASIAMQALQGFKITPQNPMAITYAKK